MRGIQWNTDLVTALPDGAVALAETAEGELQIARFAPTVWGVQPHPEADEPVLQSWAAGDRDDHLERGIDQAAVLAEIDAARAELDDVWRPLASGLVALAEAPR
jgi:GMP synthase (glutamine-hydrolysing)